LILLVCWLLLGSWTASPLVHGRPVPRAIVLAWDGAPSGFVRDLLRQGKLPNLAKLIEGGTFAESVIPVFPSKTAPGFASLWTGAPPRKTGISGNRIPRQPRTEHTISESISAFASAPLLAEPIWAVAARAGRKVFLSYIPLGRERSEHAVKFQGYGAFSGRDGVISGRTAKPREAASWSHLPDSAAAPLEISFTIGLSTFFGLFVDDPDDGNRGYDTLIVTGMRDGRDIKARIKSAPAGQGGALVWSRAIEVRIGDQKRVTSYLRLFSLARDGSDFFLYYTRPTHDRVSHPELLIGASSAVGAFIGNGASLLYHRGELGLTLPQGGTGQAEARYLETIQFAQHQLMETNRWALDHIAWDLFLAYTPFPDEADHLWHGYLDPNLPGFNREVAARLRPYLEQVYRSCDDFLGLFVGKRQADTIIALVSDHGVEGVSKRFAINQLLAKAGLLSTDEHGRVDLARTKLLYPSINNGYVMINSSDQKGGIVAPEERSAIIKRFRELAAQFRDGGKQVITAVFDAQSEGEKMGIGGEAGGDIYLDLLPGYEFDPRLGIREMITDREPHGTHGFNPRRPSMRTILLLNGPGIIAGKRLRDISLVDFAPTLAKLLHLPVPKDATGQLIEEALREPH